MALGSLFSFREEKEDNLLVEEKEKGKELHDAATIGDCAAVSALLSHKGTNVNFQDDLQRTPLYRACFYGHEEVVKMLLFDSRTELNARQKQRATPFFAACQEGHASIVSLLLQAKNIEINSPKDENATPFFMACQENRLEVVKVLLRDPRIDLNSVNFKDATPFFIACEQGHHELVRILAQDTRIDINRPRNDGITPLWLATSKNDLKLVELILAAPIQVDTEAQWALDKKTAIQHAEMWDYLEIASLLRAYEANPQEIRIQLLKKHKILESFVADIFALTIFFCDGYLQEPQQTYENRDIIRFFRISKQLPIELQMVLANKTLRSSKNIIGTKYSEPAFRRLALASSHHFLAFPADYLCHKQKKK